MRRFGKFLFMLILGLPLLVRADTSSTELERNRAQLEKWRSDPEHLARLRQELRSFLALPVERQAALRELDYALHETDSATYARLHRVMERYSEWLSGLSAEQRQRIEAAPDSGSKLRLIKEFREQEWIELQPKAVREALTRLSPTERESRINALRSEERKRKDEWSFALRNWEELTRAKPQTPRPDQTAEVKAFIAEALLPMLSTEEKRRLQQALGQSPVIQQTLVELSDKHPIKLPGPSTGPSTFRELPVEVRKSMPFLKNLGVEQAPRLKEGEGKWPDYAIVVAQMAERRGVALSQQLGPSKPEEFTAAVRRFLGERLLPILGPVEKKQLLDAEGHWPRYPQTLLRLAHKYGLQVPGMGLPGPREFWDKYRGASRAGGEKSATAGAPLPDVPDARLREFMRSELTPEERAELPSFSVADWTSRELLKEAYFRRYPKELQRLRQADLKKQNREPKN